MVAADLRAAENGVASRISAARSNKVGGHPNLIVPAKLSALAEGAKTPPAAPAASQLLVATSTPSTRGAAVGSVSTSRSALITPLGVLHHQLRERPRVNPDRRTKRAMPAVLPTMALWFIFGPDGRTVIRLSPGEDGRPSG